MKPIVFSEPARADVRRLDRDTAMRIFTALHRFAESGVGDVKQLKGGRGELRLGLSRAVYRGVRTLHINRVLHRKEAYR